jgi:hypothetical protein
MEIGATVSVTILESFTGPASNFAVYHGRRQVTIDIPSAPYFERQDVGTINTSSTCRMPTLVYALYRYGLVSILGLSGILKQKLFEQQQRNESFTRRGRFRN